MGRSQNREPAIFVLEKKPEQGYRASCESTGAPDRWNQLKSRPPEGALLHKPLGPFSTLCATWLSSEIPFPLIPHPSHTVDGDNPAPPKKPWNDASPVNTKKTMVCPFQVVQNGLCPSTL